MTIDKLAIMTEYEAGHAITAIEWVTRAGKPIIEIGGRLITPTEIDLLAEDLNHCIEISGELDVYGFMMRDRDDWWQFGFYRHSWAMAALLHLQQETPRIQGAHAHWVRGLLFGYDAEAIQRFMSSACDGPASISRLAPCSHVCRRRKVEIYDCLASFVRPHSNPNGKFQQPC